jgi:hypothetical protein
MIRLSRLFLLALILQSAPAAVVSEPGRVFVYAQFSAPGHGLHEVQCDGTPLARIKRGTFFAVNLPSGRHIFTAENTAPAVIEVRPGTDSFLRFEANVLAEAARAFLLSTSPDLAHRDMRYLKYIAAKWALSDSVPRQDPRPPEEPHFRTRDN